MISFNRKFSEIELSTGHRACHWDQLLGSGVHRNVVVVDRAHAGPDFNAEDEMNKRAVLLAGLLILFAMMLTAPAVFSADVPELVVGEICAMTGPTSPTHLMCMSGSRDYIEHVNSLGGIRGSKGTVKLKVVGYDSQYMAAKARDSFTRLADQGMIVLTHCAAGHSDGLVLEHERFGIPLVTGSLGVASMWSDWVYANYHPGIVNMIRTWVLWVKSKWESEGKPGGKLILGAIEGNEPWTPLALWGIDEFARDVGVEIITEKMPKGTTNATLQLSRLYDTGAREIFVLSSLAGAVVVLNSAKSMKLDITLTQCAASTLGDVIQTAGAELAEGYQGSYYYEPISKDSTLPTSKGMLLAKGLWKKNHPDEKPRDMYINGVLSGMIIVEAVKLALDEVRPEELDGAALKKHGLDRIRNFTGMGLTNPISYIPGDLDSHIGQRHVRYWVCKGGVVHPLTKWLKTTTYRIP